MVAITTPVTTGGKKRTIRANSGAIRKPMAAEAITAPNTAWMPPGPPTMAVIVATPAKEVPCTSGRREPKNGIPKDCRIVARPPMNRQQAISSACSSGATPAAPPMIRGGAMIPPYMVRTCCRP